MALLLRSVAALIALLVATSCGEGRARPGSSRPSAGDAGARDVGSTPDGCAPMCDGLECGPDPICGVDCGGCGSGICFLGRCLGGGRDASAGADATAVGDGSCAPSCGGRECGPDPVCGVFCGSCETGSCNNGRCEATSSSAPRILSWALSSNDLTPSRSVLISAVVTDPDGIDDLVGGTLLDSQGRAYGTFATAATEGSYSLSISWVGANQIHPISGAPLSLDLVARFFDVAGNMVERTFSLSVHCDDAALTPCEGRCTDLNVDLHNCGACDFGCVEPAVISSSADHCIDAHCINNIPTFDPSSGGSTCHERCTLLGFVCDPSLAGGQLGFASYSDSCGTLNLTTCDQPAPGTRSCGASTGNRTWFQCNCWRDEPWAP